MREYQKRREEGREYELWIENNQSNLFRAKLCFPVPVGILSSKGRCNANMRKGTSKTLFHHVLPSIFCSYRKLFVCFFLTARNTSNDTKNGQKMPPLLSFQDLFIHFYSSILTILWLCFFQGVHQSADSFQDKDNLCHLLPKMKNNKGLA